MKLDIPVRLEQYLEEIKRQSSIIGNTNKLTIVQLGTTKSTKYYKKLLLLVMKQHSLWPKKARVRCSCVLEATFSWSGSH